MINPQPHEYTKALAVKLMSNFHYLVEHKNSVAKQPGIFAKIGIAAGFRLHGYDSKTVLPIVVTSDKSTGKQFLPPHR